MPGMDLNKQHPYDLAIVGAGLLALIVSFISGFSASFSGGGFSYSHTWSAWHSYAVLGMLLLAVATAIAALRVFMPEAIPGNLPVGAYLATAAAAGLGTLLVFVRGVTLDAGPSGSLAGFTYKASAGLSWGGWLIVILGIAMTVLAVMRSMAQ